MVRIQTSTDAEYLDNWAKNYGYEVRTIQSERGYIYDRWGNLLAGNEEVYEIGIELQFVKNPAAIASTMSNLLDLDYGFVFKAANTPYVPGETVYVTLVDFISYEKIQELSALKSKYENNNPYGQAILTRLGLESPPAAHLSGRESGIKCAWFLFLL